MSEVTGALLLREAAEHIEVVGLNQDGGLYAYPQGVTNYRAINRDTLPCCAMGALDVVCRRHDIDLGLGWTYTYARAREALYAQPELTCGSIAEWNDMPTTTQADVTRVLRAAADQAEAVAA